MTAVIEEGPLASNRARGYPSNLKRVNGKTLRVEKKGCDDWRVDSLEKSGCAVVDDSQLNLSFRYDNPLSSLGQHISSDLGLTKRHFFEIPTSHCNLDLDEYEYEEDFE